MSEEIEGSEEGFNELTPSKTHVEEKQLPELTFKNVAMDIVHGVKALFYNPEVSRAVGPGLVLIESVILKIIVNKVPYTEIDYSTYMQQIQKVKDGELIYDNIYGDTGPLVYPAGHIFIYSWMDWFTENMDDIHCGQSVFRWLYLVTYVLQIAVYFVGGNFEIAPWCFFLLSFSKRLHSIYVLRLFNDCWEVIFAIGSIVALQQAVYWKKYKKFSIISFILTYLAIDLYSIAISIKMNGLLYLPGFLYIIYLLCDENLLKVIPAILFGLYVQFGMSYQYLRIFSNDEESIMIRESYLRNAFNFKRKFLYEWTVNWRFLSEENFSSDNFHKLLLFLHILVLIIFILFKWLSPKITGKSIIQFIIDFFKFYSNTISEKNIIFNKSLGPRLVMIVLSISNLIGILFARSLHYQFLSWYFYSIPFLLWFSGLPSIISILIFICHEWCWNVYPSTNESSILLISILSLIILSIFFNFNNIFSQSTINDKEKEENEKKNK
ncbi:hypothetical protein B5S31_g4715 [[Candida] boidinii]|nr:hypothetical protein B5S29_g4924 [[Candida] boidinii]OWB74883.1 hypothetical protein B5S31_g4715 [[Candida] boidinii]